MDKVRRNKYFGDTIIRDPEAFAEIDVDTRDPDWKEKLSDRLDRMKYDGVLHDAALMRRYNPITNPNPQGTLKEDRDAEFLRTKSDASADYKGKEIGKSIVRKLLGEEPTPPRRSTGG